eukprot:SAG31_NODE_4903_length_2876_cov_3.418437_3_plen_125_part_00
MLAPRFGTSVGSGAITVNQACIFAAIFEMLGAVLMGSSVGETIRKGIVDLDCFYENEAVLMLGMTMALAGAGIWVLVRSYFLVFVPTIREIRDFYREMSRTNRESITMYRLQQNSGCPFRPRIQ